MITCVTYIENTAFLKKDVREQKKLKMPQNAKLNRDLTPLVDICGRRDCEGDGDGALGLCVVGEVSV